MSEMTVTLFLPFCLLRYKALSALCIISSTSVPFSGKPAMPMLTVIAIFLSDISRGVSSIASRTRSAAKTAIELFVSGSMLK